MGELLKSLALLGLLELAGQGGPAPIQVSLPGYDGPAEVAVETLGRFKAAIRVQPRGETRPLTVAVAVRVSGAGAWPAEDIALADASGKPVPTTHLGTEWHRFIFTAPPRAATYILTANTPPQARMPVLPESARVARDEASGVEAIICRWYGGKSAALCMRFDDSHPTHLSVVIPELRRRKMRATFMINPGQPAYLEHKAEWERVARAGDQEFANHTMHHRGAASDEEMEREIGDAARYIQSLFPGRSPLLALNLGGGTKWTTTRPLRYYLLKYHLFVVSGSLGMDDVYGNRPAALERLIQRGIGRGAWCKAHWHYVGPGLSTSLENFRAELSIVERYRDKLWIAGLADAYKYLWQRRASRVELQRAGDRLRLAVRTELDAALFDQPLTIEVRLPAGTSAGGVRVTTEDGQPVRVVAAKANGRPALRFDVRPPGGAFLIELPR